MAGRSQPPWVLLIAARRADQISSELALPDYQTNVEADQLTSEIHAKVVAPKN